VGSSSFSDAGSFLVGELACHALARAENAAQPTTALSRHACECFRNASCCMCMLVFVSFYWHV
jgi:hypothetical protein